MSEIYNFNAEGIYYEVFFAKDDEQVEIYEKENPKNGMVFKSHKHVMNFINLLTDIFEEEVK